jgi:hypothetical protein
MKKIVYIFMFLPMCHAVDTENQRRILLHQKFNACIDQYLAHDSSGRWWPRSRYLPLMGQMADFSYSIYLKLKYQHLFFTDVNTPAQWDDYIMHLQGNEKKLQLLFIDFFRRFIIDFIVVGTMGGASIGLVLGDINDYYLHHVVYIYTAASFLRGTACLMLFWERYRILKNEGNKPRFKTMQVLDQSNAEVEELVNVTV